MAYMTQEGYDKMVAQLRHMETVDRPAASAAIAEARDKGDLSENSEYDAAKEAQGMLEMKINNLKAAIAEAKIIDASKLRSDIVQILSTVEMKNVKNGMVMKYTIVSESEANLLEMKINNLKAAIAEAKIIDASKLRSDIVQILSTVEMKNVKNGMVMKYTIVSESEANLREGKISSTTPIAQGLLGKKVGDVVEVKIPQGTIQLEILNISVGN